MSLDNFLQSAKNSGMPADQVERFLNNAHLPLPWQLNFHAAARQADNPNYPNMIALGGARGPGKSHSIMAQGALDDCIRQPGLDFLFLRKVGKAARRSLEQLRAKTFAHLPHRYDRVAGMIYFPNNSTITIGNFQTDKDIDKYLGVEFGAMAIEEYTQLGINTIDMLLGSMRTSNPDWRTRAYLSTNPGGQGHQEFKTRFVTPWRKNTQTNTLFIPATYKDNPYLDQDYINYLESLTGVLGRMWRDGDWDIGAGQYFITWGETHHVMAPQEIHYSWPMWISFDYGFQHPTVVQWHVQPNPNEIWTVAEHNQPRMLPEQHAEAIYQICNDLKRPLDKIEAVVAGHDTFHKAKDEKGQSVAQQYEKHGITMQRANINRVQGAAEMLNRLGNPQENRAPTWRIWRTCTTLIDCIPAMQTNPAHPEDVLKIDADFEGNHGDDPYDCARYGLMYAQSNRAVAGYSYSSRR